MCMKDAMLAVGLTCALGFLSSCKEEPTDNTPDNFDKGAMLENLASNVIEPFYQGWLTAHQKLDVAIETFEANRTDVNLEEVRARFLEAYTHWNRCSVFEIGPAADRNLRLSVNTFPTDTSQINANLSAGSWNLDQAQNADAKGYPAMDYVLFGQNLEETLTSLQGTGNTRLTYLQANSALISGLADEMVNAWNSYKEDFTTNTASSAGSPIGTLVNEINFEFELLKNARIGIPLGKKTLGVTQVEKLEGYYADHARELALFNLFGIQSAFEGRGGLGFDDYLDHLNAQRDGGKLSTAIMEGFDEIEAGLQEFESMKATIESSPSDLEELYNNIEKQVVLLKTDMPSQLGVQITYQDNDGD